MKRDLEGALEHLDHMASPVHSTSAAQATPSSSSFYLRFVDSHFPIVCAAAPSSFQGNKLGAQPNASTLNILIKELLGEQEAGGQAAGQVAGQVGVDRMECPGVARVVALVCKYKEAFRKGVAARDSLERYAWHLLTAAAQLEEGPNFSTAGRSLLQRVHGLLWLVLMFHGRKHAPRVGGRQALEFNPLETFLRLSLKCLQQPAAEVHADSAFFLSPQVVAHIRLVSQAIKQPAPAPGALGCSGEQPTPPAANVVEALESIGVALHGGAWRSDAGEWQQQAGRVRIPEELHKRGMARRICLRFNRNQCELPGDHQGRRHVCLKCGSRAHGLHNCPHNGRPPPRTPRSAEAAVAHGRWAAL